MSACAARPDDPPFGDDAELARQVVGRGVLVLLGSQTPPRRELIKLCRALQGVGIRLGRSPVIKDLLAPQMFKLTASEPPGIVAELFVTYVTLDLPLDLIGGLTPAAVERLPRGAVGTFLTLRNPCGLNAYARLPARARLLSFVQRRPPELGPLAISHGLAMGAGIEDRPPQEHLEVVEEAVALDPTSPLLAAQRGVALARAGRTLEAKRALYSAEQHPLSNGSPLIFSYRCWGQALLGSREMWKRTVADMVAASGNPPEIQVLRRESERVLTRVEQRKR